MPHRGIEDSSFPEMATAVQTILQVLYRDQPIPTRPVPNRKPRKHRRNEEIRSRYKAGETLEQLAAEYGISFQRVQQIIKGRNR